MEMKANSKGGKLHRLNMAYFYQKIEKQKKILFILFGVILIILIISWQQGFLKISKIQPLTETEIIMPEKKIEIDFKFLEKQILKDLQPFEEISPSRETPGRENPFLPY